MISDYLPSSPWEHPSEGDFDMAKKDIELERMSAIIVAQHTEISRLKKVVEEAYLEGIIEGSNIGFDDFHHSNTHAWETSMAFRKLNGEGKL